MGFSDSKETRSSGHLYREVCKDKDFVGGGIDGVLHCGCEIGIAGHIQTGAGGEVVSNIDCALLGKAGAKDAGHHQNEHGYILFLYHSLT